VPYSFTGSWLASPPGIAGYRARRTGALASGDAMALTELTVMLPFRHLTGELRARCRRGAPLIHRELARLSAGNRRLWCLRHERAGHWRRGGLD